MLVATSIDKDSVVPIYHQLKLIIKEQIENQKWKYDESIPSERELCEQFGISRMTVRHAINDLVSEGVLYRKRGMGTFVAKPKIDQGLTKLTNFTSDMEQRGLVPGAKVIYVKTLPANKIIAEKLQIGENAIVIELLRLRLASGEPMALEQTFLPYESTSAILNESLENKSLYQELRDKCNIHLTLAKQTLEISTISNAEDSRLLEIDTGTPVLLIKRVTFSDRSVPIEYVQSLYRADRYKFSIEMTV